MSYLRDIMRRMNARDSSAPVVDQEHASHSLESHLEDYRLNLQSCSPAMLQYEWAWLEQHLSTLQLCHSRPEMLATAGGSHRVQALIQESVRFQELIEGQFKARGLSPSLHRATVVASEHAWEITQEEILRQWGIQNESAQELPET